MSPPNSTARKLSRLLWRDRLRRGGLLVLAAAALAGAFVLTDRYRTARSDPTLESHNVRAVVAGFGSGNIARGAYIVHVRLDDGRDVDAFSTLKVAPAKGATVLLNEARHQSGRVTYDLIGLDAAAQ